ncbi:hypothetical protein BJF83_08570 [Nocardiopsis sp. CNR-923]|uniref:hypothetical protein n=1 Tax=Nocardiopsis sp. CNR-923 TaxID=1904965 RepID=UPI0009662EDB|nr:hypothetical protein [Nocardiopsis sp. CNR-923]OLT30344.1 hypothetical protein BJF83_08570 [Nocardiopsis sp. CNR-923]
MSNSPQRDSNSVYQNNPDPALPRAFLVDIWNEDTDAMEHAYYGVTAPGGRGGMARPVNGSGFHSIRSAQAFADRLCGELVWL